MKSKTKFFWRVLIIFIALLLYLKLLPSGPKTITSTLGTIAWASLIILLFTITLNYIAPPHRWYNKRYLIIGICQFGGALVLLVLANSLAWGKAEVEAWLAGIGLASLGLIMGGALAFVGKNLLEKCIRETPWPGEHSEDITEICDWLFDKGFESKGRILLHGDQLVLLATKGSSSQIDLSLVSSVNVTRKGLISIAGLRIALNYGSVLTLSDLSLPYFWKREILNARTEKTI
jgi:hypothetical protein